MFVCWNEWLKWFFISFSPSLINNNEWMLRERERGDVNLWWGSGGGDWLEWMNHELEYHQVWIFKFEFFKSKIWIWIPWFSFVHFDLSLFFFWKEKTLNKLKNFTNKKNCFKMIILISGIFLGIDIFFQCHFFHYIDWLIDQSL